MRIIFYRANRACLGLDRASQEGIGFARSLLLFVCILVVFFRLLSSLRRQHVSICPIVHSLPGAAAALICRPAASTTCADMLMYVAFEFFHRMSQLGYRLPFRPATTSQVEVHGRS